MDHYQTHCKIYYATLCRICSVFFFIYHIMGIAMPLFINKVIGVGSFSFVLYAGNCKIIKVLNSLECWHVFLCSSE